MRSAAQHGWGSGAVGRLLANLDAAARPGSRVLNRFRGDLVKLVRADFADMLTRGVDRYGKPRAPLAKSTMTRRRGAGPSLIPKGLRSEVYTHWSCSMSVEGGRSVLRAGWSGLPWIQYHLTGARKPGTNWRLPRRDVGGVTPKGWSAIHKRFRELPRELLKYGGGR